MPIVSSVRSARHASPRSKNWLILSGAACPRCPKPAFWNWLKGPILRKQNPSFCWAIPAWGNPDQLTASIDLIGAAQEAITVVDPRHPLFGRTLPCVGISNSCHRGRCCIVWIRPTVERQVPVTATNLEYDPSTLYPLPISLESLQQLLQEFLLVAGARNGDPTHADSTTACPASTTKGEMPRPHPPDRGLDDAHSHPTPHPSSNPPPDNQRLSTSRKGDRP